MTAREPDERHAGHWVAYFTTYEHDHERKTYLYRYNGGRPSWTTFADDALRFDSRTEAERHVRQLRGRMIGQRTGAEKIGWEGRFR